MERESVESTAISSVGYDPSSEILEIEFPSGAVWQYLNVPAEEFEALMAGSVGKYFHARIKGRYLENQIA